VTDSVDALRAAAHDYTARGWRVIQLHRMTEQGKCSCHLAAKGKDCGRNSAKHPRDLEWQKSPAPSYADIEAAWDRWNWNIGIATGEPSGLWVLDIDPDGDGMATMAELVATHGPLNHTGPVAQTGSGGYHYYYALPDFDLRNSQGRIGKGIDTRATGGQVVAPPSVSGKGAYTWVQDGPLHQAPDWLLELARKAEVEETERVTAADLPKPEDIDPVEWERCNRYAKSIVEAEVARLDRLAQTGWDGEPWNATTFQVACSLLEVANSPWNAYSTGHAREAVLTHAPRDDDGFDDYIVTRTFESAMQKVGPGARPYPVDRASEPDPLFDNPDVRRRPSGGDGEPTGPVVGREVTEYDFFDAKEFLAAKTAHAVMDIAPIGFGRDRDFWSYADGVWRPNHDVVEDRCVRLLGDRFRPAHVKAVSPIVRVHAQPISGDPIPEWINFRNGMLDWQTEELLDHDPAYGSTVQLGTEWQPEAECPTFDRFLADVLHEDYIDLAWEMLGYLMYSGNPEQVAFMFYGTGGNGKGTLLRVIQELLGRENVANESLDQLNNSNFSSVNLYGMIANVAGDIDATYQESTANFKKLTGEDMIGAERKYGARFKFESWAVPLFSANKIPGSADVSPGYLRRWIVLHFTKTISEAEKVQGLSDLLISELPGIARKALPFLRRERERKHFTITGEVLRGQEEFAEAIDQVRQWVASGSAIQAPEVDGALIDLYASYSIWAERSGRKNKVIETEFSHRLVNIGYPLVKIDGNDFHHGIRSAPIGHRVATDIF
jgi:P4 family phage/plasmid primase-like protien